MIGIILCAYVRTCHVFIRVTRNIISLLSHGLDVTAQVSNAPNSFLKNLNTWFYIFHLYKFGQGESLHPHIHFVNYDHIFCCMK